MPLNGERIADFGEGAAAAFDALAEFGHAFEGAHSVDARTEVPGNMVANPNGTPSDRAPQAASMMFKEASPLLLVLGIAWLVAGA